MALPPGPFGRADALRRLADGAFDVLVVGGGITGAGVALDAASRGLRTALVEGQDFAAGTSSRSSKLIHGGLRYLQQGEIRLVYEALAERQRLTRLAPHLVRLLPFLIPLLGRGGPVPPKLARALRTALWMYDLTGGARIGRVHQRVSREEALGQVPTLDPERVMGGFVYWDAHTDDARLTLAVARTAGAEGAVVANGAMVVGVVKEQGQVRGALVEAGGERIDVRAEVVVNATGVWADRVQALDAPAAVPTLRPAKGIHLTVPWDRVRNQVATVLPVPRDRRSVFVIPLAGRTYIGTTDTDYDGPLDDPRCTPEDVAYVLGAVNASLADPLGVDDVVGSWAGLRPLVRAATTARTADLSRRHQVTVSASGLVSVTGGKLTTYRRMAADTVDAVAAALGRGGRSRTARLPLVGADGTEELRAPGAARRLGVDPELLQHLVGRYGGEARALVAMIQARPELGERLVPDLPYRRAEVVYGARYEMARSLDDLLSRRVPLRWLAAEGSAAVAGDVAALVADELGWTAEQAASGARAYREAVIADRQAAGLPVGATVAAP